METFEWIILLLFGAALLSAIARRFGIPYPTLLAIGGACLAFVPESPGWTLDPHLALTLFVAPVLLDAAYDSSPRDLRDNWRAVGSLAVFAVGITTAAIAVIVRWIVPDMPWPVAIALGAIVAPPDAAAATAVVRQLKLPHNILTILEGESLVNDASALLVYRLAVIAAVSGNVSPATVVPTFLLVVIGSIVAGLALGWIVEKINVFFDDVPTALILQFVTTFGVWMAAEGIGLSGILTIVTYAIVLARLGRIHMPASRRVRVNAVWETVVFVLNIFAFVLIGMQLQPIWQRLDASQRSDYVLTALAVLATAIVARFVWVMTFTGMRILQGAPISPRMKLSASASMRGSLVVSWAGMRGIVTLATAFALPETLADGSPFPYRDLILLCAFAVVFGTLVLQGLTLRPLIKAMQFRTGSDVVSDEVRHARSEAYQAALKAIDGDESEEAERLRRDYAAAIELVTADGTEASLEDMPGNDVRRRAVAAARQRANRLRLDGEIGDEAYRVLESEFDWAELSAGAAES
jgi:CPA1 family monovalent cation:H+ antiporter